jgi:hypothetical protein
MLNDSIFILKKYEKELEENFKILFDDALKEFK